MKVKKNGKFARNANYLAFLKNKYACNLRGYMVQNNFDKKPVPDFIRKLCPHLNEEKLQEATENVREYLKVCLRIYERLQEEKKTGEEPQSLTGLKRNTTIPSKRSKPI